ncbi:hypothetical protein PHJA_002831000 [Phtheirospermum japonicum]|uniref:Uncharacterized protein n=1 Tax=Phtheirospermum japonicum TaxID=374723 RepID=A0A830D6G9_9LAMI|nr:hypothetical protein PHJA_002831000 [Phtheirospermum japonicum]
MIIRHMSCRLGLGSMWRHDLLKGGELSNNLIMLLTRDAKEDSGRFSSLLSSSSSPRVGFSRSSTRLSFQADFGDMEFSSPFIVDDVDPPDSQTSLNNLDGRNGSEVSSLHQDFGYYNGSHSSRWKWRVNLVGPFGTLQASYNIGCPRRTQGL